jgi:hypothetical protein
MELPRKSPYLLAIASFLLIPVVLVLAGIFFASINPEIAAGHPNYERNYRLMELVKHLSMLAALLAGISLWFLTCFFLLQAKQQSYWWMLLGLLGWVGFIILTILTDNAPAPRDLYLRFLRKLRTYPRLTYEVIFFVVVWVVAYETMILKRDLMIIYEAATTGTSAAQIISLQNASSGMWAFREGLEVQYLVVLFYLLLPIVFNAVAHLAAASRTFCRHS